MDYSKEIDKIKHRIWVGAIPNNREWRYFKLVQKFGEKYWRYLPGIKAIALVNSTALCMTHDMSDIDLFVVTRPRYLMLIRILITLYARIEWLYGRGGDDAGKFCFSFFADTTHLDMSEIALEGGDPYLALWTSRMTPVMTQSGWYHEWIRANTWIDSEQFDDVFKKNIEHPQKNYPPFVDSCLQNMSHLLYRLYIWIRKRYRINKTPIKTPWGVIIEEGIQKLHPNDRRMEWKNK